MTPEILGLAQDSADSAVFERRVLALLEREVGFDAAFFTVRGAEDSQTVVGLDSVSSERLIARGHVYGEELLPVKRAALERSEERRVGKECRL